MTVKTINGKAIANVKTINGKVIANVKTLNGQTISHSDRFWVGGTGNTNDTAHWSLSSGGTGGASTTDNTLNAIWDGNSGGGTCTFNASFTCLGFNSTGYTGTLAGSAAINIAASFALGATITRTYTSAMTLSSVVAGNTITLNGKTTASAITYNGVGGAWTVQDNWNNGSSNMILTAGSVDFNAKTITMGTFTYTGTGVRSITTGAATMSVVGMSCTDPTNLTASFASSSITCSGGTSTLGSQSYNNYTITSTAFATLLGVNTFVNLTRTNTSGYVTLTLGANQTVSGAFTVTGNNITTQRLFVNSNAAGTQRTITCNGTTSLTNVDFQDTLVNGSAAPVSGTSMGNAGNCSGINFTSPVTRYYVSPAGSNAITSNNWSATTGGATGDSIPICHDTLIFDGSSFGGAGRTVTTTTSGLRIGNMDWSAVSNSPILNLSTSSWIGSSYIFTSGMSQTGAGTATISGRNACSFTSGGLSFINPFDFSSPAGSLTFQDNFTTTGLVQLLDGTIIDNGKIISCGILGLAGSTRTRAYTKTGDLTLTSTGTVLQGSATGLTWSDTAGTIKLTDNSVSTKTILLTGFVFNNYWNATAGTGVVTISGSNTFADIKIDAGRTQQFSAGSTTTFATWTASGALANLITIGSSTAANHNLVSLGVAVVCSFMSISRSQASGAVFTATSSTDGGNNSGWVITP